MRYSYVTFSLIVYSLLFSSLKAQVYKVQNLSVQNGQRFIFEAGMEFQNKYYYNSYNAVGAGLVVFDGESIQTVYDQDTAAYFVSGLTVFQDKLIFIGDVLSSTGTLIGNEPCYYDGQDIQVIKDINPGSLSSMNNNSYFDLPPFVPYNGKLYFKANSGSTGREIWMFDGTSAQEHDLLNGPSGSEPESFTVFDNKLFFSARGDETQGRELWFTDGTQWQQLADIYPGPGSSNPGNLMVIDDVLYFSATDSTHGVELWSYNGVTLQRESDIIPGTGSSSPQSFLEHNQTLYFAAFDSMYGIETYRFLNNSVERITNLSTQIVNQFGTYPAYSFNGDLILSVSESFQDYKIFKYQSSQSQLLYNNSMLYPIQYNGKLYFRSEYMGKGAELLVYDGNSVQLAIDFVTGSESGFPVYPGIFQNKMIWSTSQGLLKTDGQTFDYLGVDLTGGISGISSNSNDTYTDFWDIMDTLCFRANFGSGFEMADLTCDGISPNEYILALPDSLQLATLFFVVFPYNGKYYFRAQSKDNYLNYYLMAYDPMPKQSNLIGPIKQFNFPAIYQNKLYFVNSDSNFGSELYEYDGTSIQRVSDVDPGSDSGVGISQNVVYQNKLYFLTFNDPFGFELQSYDGSQVDLVHNFNWSVSATRSHYQEDLIVYKNKLYMPGYTNNAGEELFMFDGTNVTQAPDINGAGASGSPTDFHVLHDHLYFIAYQGGSDFIPALYKYDGSQLTLLTSADQRLNDIMGIYDDKLILDLHTPENGAEVWSFDGNSLSMIKDIFPGSVSSNPNGGFVHNDIFYFVANDGLYGWQLYALDTSNCPMFRVLQDPITADTTVTAQYNVQLLPTCTVDPNHHLTLEFGKNLLVEPGFELPTGGILTANLDGCNE